VACSRRTMVTFSTQPRPTGADHQSRLVVELVGTLISTGSIYGAAWRLIFARSVIGQAGSPESFVRRCRKLGPGFTTVSRETGEMSGNFGWPEASPHVPLLVDADSCQQGWQPIPVKTELPVKTERNHCSTLRQRPKLSLLSTHSRHAWLDFIPGVAREAVRTAPHSFRGTLLLLDSPSMQTWTEAG
jgi:hypothetical protein